MHHLAIMNPSWGLLPKVVSGEKSIESRWSQKRTAPYGKVAAGDVVYFKDSGAQVTAKAEVAEVISYEHLTPTRVGEIVAEYGTRIGIPIEGQEAFLKLVADKKYCTLMFLKNATAITPFSTHKRGFSAMSAWLTVADIDLLRLN